MEEEGDRQGPMSESASQLAGQQETLTFADPAAVNRRVWRNMFVVIILSVAAAAIFSGLRFTVGVALGGALALLNYKWLHSSLRAILAVGGEKAPPGTRLKMVVRWLVVAAIAWAAHQTGQFDAVGIVAGLTAPAAAIMIEAAYVTYKTLAQGNGER
jgi:hypothetical protein